MAKCKLTKNQGERSIFGILKWMLNKGFKRNNSRFKRIMFIIIGWEGRGEAITSFFTSALEVGEGEKPHPPTKLNFSF